MMRVPNVITLSGPALLFPLFSPVQCKNYTNSTCGTSGNLTAFNASISHLGCYTDNNGITLQGLSSAPDSLNSPQYCANVCGGLGYKYSGLETS